MKHTKLISMVAAGLVAGIGFAETGAIGWQKGASKNATLHKQYEVVSSFTDDASREACFKNNEIGGKGIGAEAQHLDSEKLFESGMIDEATQKAIAEAASKKHGYIHSLYAGADFENMSKKEIEEFYENKKSSVPAMPSLKLHTGENFSF